MLILTFSKLDPYNININSPIGLRVPGHVAQSVASPTADPGVMSSIPARSHTFVGIFHEMISTVILLLPSPSADARTVVVSICRKYW